MKEVEKFKCTIIFLRNDIFFSSVDATIISLLSSKHTMPFTSSKLRST